jgi:hypothetical protein
MATPSCPSPPLATGMARHYAANASSVLRPQLTGPARTLVPRAIFDGAIHLGDPAGSGIEVAVVAPQAVVHPHAVVLSTVGGSWPFGTLHLDDEVEVGDRVIRWGDTVVQVTRWWSPTPALGPTETDRLAAATRIVRTLTVGRTPPLASVEADRLQHLIAALRDGDGPAASAAALALLGLGAGATPTGDDLLAGLLAGIDRFAAVLDPPPDPRVLTACRQAAEAVLDRSARATTALSAVLLRHAVQGQVCRPAARLIVAMARGLDEKTLREALNGLLAVGSSSGRDLTLGLLAAADVLVPVDGPDHLDVHTPSGAPAHLDVRDVAVTAATSPSIHGRL